MMKTPTTSMVQSPQRMTCGGCVRRLTGVLEELDGAENVVVTLKPGQAQVAGSVTRERLAQAVINAGFTVCDQTSTTDSATQSESGSCSNS